MPSEPFQDEFSAALFDPAIPAPEFAVAPDQSHAPKRFNVYRNNVITSLIEAMGQGFPVVKQLVGDEFFSEMARQYVRGNPPANPLMMFYGANFPEFIEGFEAASSLPYLADMARLEYARREAYFAGDETLLGAEWFQNQHAEYVSQARICLHGSVRIITSPFPIFDIWQKHQEAGHAISNEAQNVLIARPEMTVNTQKVPMTMVKLVQALETQPLEAAIAEVMTDDPEADIGAVIPLIIGLAVQNKEA